MDEEAQAEEHEFRWIESEAMNEQDRINRLDKRQELGGEVAECLAAHNDGEEEEVEGLSDLFADPDPLDTFHFQYKLPVGDNKKNNNNNDSPTSSRVVEISLSGHKAELGQTLHSTGLTLWRASKLLSDFLVRACRPDTYPPLGANATTRNRRCVGVQGQRVLELGSGLGLCGILAHHLGAREVILTDGDTDVLAKLRKNVQANCVQGGSHPPDSIATRQLVWGHQIESFLDSHGQFDIVMGADIIYTLDSIEPLWSSVSRLLLPTGTFLLAYARRNVSVDHVLETATKFGFVWKAPAENSEGVFVFSRTE